MLRQSHEELSSLGPGVSLRLNIQALHSHRCQAGWTTQSDTSEKAIPSLSENKQDHELLDFFFLSMHGRVRAFFFKERK